MDPINKVLLRNDSKTPLRMAVEPWAWQYKIQPGKTVEVVAGEQDKTFIEVDYSDGFLSIYGWSDDMKVMIDGKEMEMDFT